MAYNNADIDDVAAVLTITAILTEENLNMGEERFYNSGGQGQIITQNIDL